MPERADDSPRWILRRRLKVGVAAALRAARVPRLVAEAGRRRAGGARVLVFSYHRVEEDFAASARDAIPSLLVSARTLRLQLEDLARTHEVVSLDDAIRVLSAPAGRWRRDVAAVTFDDGYADNHDVALPVLSALGLPAAIFVATGFTGTRRRLVHDRLWAALVELARRGVPPARAGLPAAEQALLAAGAASGPAATIDRLIARLPHPALLRVAEALERRTGLSEEDLPAATRLLRWEELRDLAAAGVEVGGHSVHHAVLANLPLAEARREIAGCRDAIAERLGRRPRHFAYPNGYHTPAVRRVVAEEGFEAAFTTEDRENLRGRGLHAVARKVLWEDSTLGPDGYSPSLAACCFQGVFRALGLSRAVDGERPDAPAGAAAPAPPAAPGRAAILGGTVTPSGGGPGAHRTPIF